jgi:nucleoid DNA-binding protein
MRKLHWCALAATAALGVIVGMSVQAQTDKKQPSRPLHEMVAKKTKLSEDDVKKVLEALGPAIREKLANGETLDLPNLGTFRVVRIPEHKDLVKGRPATIEAVNNVEFVPVGDLFDAANAASAVPAVTVPAFEYNPLPGQTRSERAPLRTREPTVRER